MKPRIGSALLGLAVLILGSPSLSAEESGTSCALKLRGLLSSTSSDQGMSNNVIGSNLAVGTGFGIELGYGVGPGKITAELGYSVQTGDAYMGNPSEMKTYGDSVVVDSAKSIDSRKNKLDGMTLRLGWEAPWTQSFSWRAGLQFGGNKFTHQVLGNTYGTVGAAKTPFADAYVYTGSESSTTPSPYVGVTYKFDDSSSLEFGVLLLNYKSVNYQHVANTMNQLDTAPTSSRSVPNLEVAYVFRF